MCITNGGHEPICLPLSAAGKNAAWAELCVLLEVEVLGTSAVVITDTTQRQQRTLPLKQAKLAHADRERSAKPTGTTTEDEQHATGASTKLRRAAVVDAADEVPSCLDARRRCLRNSVWKWWTKTVPPKRNSI
jgi:hypothetical protein